MKLRFYSALLLFSLVTMACTAQPVINFEKSTQHLGFVHQGDTLSFQYLFTNMGNQPLVISDTKVQCGCTVVQKPAEPIQPGKTGVIKARFITNSAIDRQDRTIIVISNASNPSVELRFKCVVLKAKDKS
jgi:hypothetical protein